MLTRRMPKSGDELSVLGFGCMRLPMKDGAIDEARATAQVRHAIERGVNYLDTAWPYHGGESEPFVGRALSGGWRDKVRLATKLPTWLVNTRADMDRFLDAQLKRLRTDRIDYYLVHALDGAMRKALLPSYPELSELRLADYKVRVLNEKSGTAAAVRVLIDQRRKTEHWGTVGVSNDIIEASWQALVDGIEYMLLKNKK